MSHNYSSAIQEVGDNWEEQAPSELQKAQELLELLGDPRVRVSVPTESDKIPSEPNIEPVTDPSIARRYQVA
jgi:hypothetical protein